MTLYCPRCGGDQVIEFGVPSKVDGKKDHTCLSCDLVMGPLRSRIVTLVLMAIAGLLALGSVGAFVASVAALLLEKGKPGSVLSGYVCIVVVFGTAIASVIACYKDLRIPKPLKYRPQVTTWVKEETGRTNSIASKDNSSSAVTKHNDKGLCYICGKPLEPDELSKRVYQACQA